TTMSVVTLVVASATAVVGRAAAGTVAVQAVVAMSAPATTAPVHRWATLLRCMCAVPSSSSAAAGRGPTPEVPGGAGDDVRRWRRGSGGGGDLREGIAVLVGEPRTSSLAPESSRSAQMQQ